jgi:hypothetical protein
LTRFTLIITFLVFAFGDAHALECPWWQTKVRSHPIKESHEKGYKVSAHEKGEFCRNRWTYADFFIQNIKDTAEAQVTLDEKVKPWTKTEKIVLLQELAKTSEVYEMKNYHFYRSNMDAYAPNPAVSYPLTRSIVLFDKFFIVAKKDDILVHESGHYLFSKLSKLDSKEFDDASGGTTMIIQKVKIRVPPKKLIKPDSSESLDEDFSNYLEIHYSNKALLKNENSKVFNFLAKRFKE